MALHAVVAVEELDSGFVLAPERYDPRRTAYYATGLTIGDIAETITELVSPSNGADTRRFVVLNTGDAREGLVGVGRPAVSISEVGSTKKIIRSGDVIISRLRPYLRQVALVDRGLLDSTCNGAMVACSTEFYVLRSRSSESIAFLVPFLLSDRVQAILQASQEGGHHPRFSQRALERIALPERLVACRHDLSVAFETAVDAARQADLSMRSLVAQAAELAGSGPNMGDWSEQR